MEEMQIDGFRERLTGVFPAHLRTGTPWCTALLILTAQLKSPGAVLNLVWLAHRQGEPLLKEVLMQSPLSTLPPLWIEGPLRWMRVLKLSLYR